MLRFWQMAALAVALLGASMGSAAQPNKKIRVVILDGQNNHNWRATTPLMKKELERSGRFAIEVSSFTTTSDSTTVPFPPDLSKYDVVLSNYNGKPWPPEFDKALEENLKAGKIALVIVHAANNSFEGWGEYNRMIGMGWRNNKFGKRLIVDTVGKEIVIPKGEGAGAGHGPRHPFLVTIRDADHPVTKGMPREWLHAKDELYHGMRGPAENVHLLATSFDEKKFGGTNAHEPMIWTVSYGKGRVFHTPMGHDAEAMRCVGFLTTLQRGTEWAATGSVTIPIPANFPTATRSSSASPD
jgi:type 1 glutamine amidotransferase